MSIEDQLQEISGWLQSIAQSLDAGIVGERKAITQPKKKPDPKKGTKKKEEPKEDDDLGLGDDDVIEDPKYTENDLMDELRTVIQKKGKDKGRALLKKYDAGRVTEIAPDKVEAFYKDCQVVLNE